MKKYRNTEIKIPRSINEELFQQVEDDEKEITPVASPTYVKRYKDKDKLVKRLSKDFEGKRKFTKNFVKDNANIDLHESISTKNLINICSCAQDDLGKILHTLASDDKYNSSLIADVDIDSLDKASKTIEKLRTFLMKATTNESLLKEEVEEIGGVPVTNIKLIAVAGEDDYIVKSVDTDNREFIVTDSDDEESTLDFDFVADGVADKLIKVKRLVQKTRPEGSEVAKKSDYLVTQVGKDDLWLQVYDTLVADFGNAHKYDKDYAGLQTKAREKRYDVVLPNNDGLEVWDHTEKGLDRAKEVAKIYGLKTRGPYNTRYSVDNEYYQWKLVIYIPKNSKGKRAVEESIRRRKRRISR